MQENPPGAAASEKHNVGRRPALGHTLLVDPMILHSTKQVGKIAAKFKASRSR